MAKPNSKWLGEKRRRAGEGAPRHSAKATVEHGRWIPDKHGTLRHEVDSPTESAFVQRLTRRPEGWAKGAKVIEPRKRNVQ